MLVDLPTKDDFQKFKIELVREFAIMLKLEEPVLPGEGVEKLQLGISVAQLALLLRAAIDAGIIVNENKTAVLRCVVLFMRTTKTEGISTESLRKKFYEAERSTKEAVKDLLMEMFKKVVKY